MRAARALSIGSLPPEWGGPRHGGVATAHRVLVEQLVRGDAAAQVVGVVSPAPLDGGGAPVTCYAPQAGTRITPDVVARAVARSRPDVLILQHFANAAGDAAAQAAPDLPAVGIAHSWHAMTRHDDHAARERERDKLQRGLDRLSALVIGSHHTYREGVALGLRYPRRTEVVHYALTPGFADPLEVDRPRSGVVYAGSFEPRKNPGALIDAIALLDDVELTLIGANGLEDRLREQIGALGLGERVRIQPPGPVEGLRETIAAAEVFCMPSTSESFGLVYTEALASGTPVVGFGPTMREIARAAGVDIGVGLDVTTPEAIAAAIEMVRSKPVDREVLRTATLRAFDAVAWSARYARLLSDVAGPRTPSSDEVERRVASFPRWHYAFDLGGVMTPPQRPEQRNRHAQRMRYFFEPFVEACGGSLAGKRVLDLGCNAGFWSLAAIEAGAEHVLGLDGRAMHVEQAQLVFEAKGIAPERYDFRVADVYTVELEQRFDVVLFLGLMYHVNDPVRLFERISDWAADVLVVDTSLSKLPGSGFELIRESTADPRNALESPFVLRPTAAAVTGLGKAFGFGVRPLVADFPDWSGCEDFRDGRRQAFLMARETAL